MPRNTYHRLDGVLLDSRRGLILRTGDGGEWLVALRRHRHALLGQRVVVEGPRIGFDELWPDRITRVEHEVAPPATRRRFPYDFLRRVAQTIGP